MYGRDNSQKGRAVLHEAANGALIGCQNFRLAKERPCMIKDAKSVTGFGGQLRNVVSPKEIMAESETQEFE